MDLTMIGLNKKPKIEVIKFVRRNENRKVWEVIGLEKNEHTEEEKELIINKGSFGTLIDILTKR